MQHLYVHPDNPQPRLINQVVDCLHNGGVIVYPTDTTYALGCGIDQKKALERIIQLRQLDPKHQFSLVCRDLSEIANFAVVDNHQFKVLKANTPSQITFVLTATKDVPKRLAHSKKKTIGIRVPTNPISQLLLETYDAPMLTTTLIAPEQDLALDDPFEIVDIMGHGIDILIDAGIMTSALTTVVDLTETHPQLIRQGVADVGHLVS